MRCGHAADRPLRVHPSFVTPRARGAVHARVGQEEYRMNREPTGKEASTCARHNRTLMLPGSTTTDENRIFKATRHGLLRGEISMRYA